MLDFLFPTAKKGQQADKTETVVSFLLGVGIIVVIGFVIINFLQSRGQSQEPPIEPSEITPEGSLGDASRTVGLPTEHTVAPGETLWSIAEKYYSSGYNWVDIAKANPTINPDWIEAGGKLVIPKAEALQTTAVTVPQAVDNKITGNSYTVTSGDTIWSIALRAYGDAYRWVDIAKANGLTDPNLIHKGNVLKISR